MMENPIWILLVLISFTTNQQIPKNKKTQSNHSYSNRCYIILVSEQPIREHEKKSAWICSGAGLQVSLENFRDTGLILWDFQGML